MFYTGSSQNIKRFKHKINILLVTILSLKSNQIQDFRHSSVHCVNINTEQHYNKAKEDTHSDHLVDKYSEACNSSFGFKHPSLCVHYTLILHYGFQWNSTHILWSYARVVVERIQSGQLGFFFYVCFSVPTAAKILLCLQQPETFRAFTYTQIFQFMPLLQKSQYSDSAIFMDNENEHSTIISICMQPCSYSDYCNVKQSVLTSFAAFLLLLCKTAAMLIQLCDSTFAY